MLLLWFDLIYLCRDTKSATVKLLHPRWSGDDPFDTLGNVKFLYKQGIIQIDAIMI